MPAKLDASLTKKLTGIIPPITMPFDAKGNLVTSAIAEQIDFMIEQGVDGMVAGGSTGEGHTLNFEEFTASMKAVHDAIDGRVPFLAGLIINSTRSAIERAEALKGLNVAAMQVTPVHYLFKPSEEATVQHFRTIWEETGIPIIIYNVVPWNYLSADLMLRIMDEVPGVIGMKQSAGDLKLVSDLLHRLKPDNVVLTGTDALLYPAFSLGVHGAISALTSAVPAVTAKLWNLVKSGDHREALALHYRLADLWDALPHDNLPACVKYCQHRQGLPLHLPRAPMEPVSSRQQGRINEALEALLV
ncbi:dihydrodipicolinate synthase family protein [Sinorhizobium meliloti]|uniref:dihydrodipicolinate synthase family protein n=1 Tax=Rhizobium meliloti TaxID=382 RepID=UPI000EFD0767|nr:dihydrodipicolinate synthase family protein [Sinorhizobium meliloti]RMC64859.1 dihydrodipicolinate synthase family protein [Sinorhizobium meliloti]RVO43546.1 dihydrodipicolinate synthase family protein [Sinorhizobium meliloti]